ncbi:MAG: hypothetical protein ACJ8R9_04220 [Steroidobacteraceae bacterium]
MNRRRICVALITLVAAVAGPTRADVSEDSVTIKVGQELFVSFTPNGDSLVSPKTLPNADGPDAVVTIQLTQSGPTRTLLVTNGYARSLGCRIKARKRGSRKETELPVSSVRSGLQSVMSLSEPFDELVLFEFHLQG